LPSRLRFFLIEKLVGKFVSVGLRAHVPDVVQGGGNEVVNIRLESISERSGIPQLQVRHRRQHHFCFPFWRWGWLIAMRGLFEQRNTRPFLLWYAHDVYYWWIVWGRQTLGYVRDLRFLFPEAWPGHALKGSLQPGNAAEAKVQVRCSRALCNDDRKCAVCTPDILFLECLLLLLDTYLLRV
jgi:hypothetical protein